MSDQYEIVWCAKNILYVYNYIHVGPDYIPLELPDGIENIMKFLIKKGRAAMVYRLKQGSYCSHYTKGKFGDAKEWLDKHGFIEENQNVQT
jgi:hypothetical protein